ncbi:succinate dehydrogenase cytochrome b subunit [Modestobacter sp. L9-4]|uniref:succinate dehydrogenase cytochrome b subunit n=1 Tax=Modestobacter sp. L9-4 TaxID=2851567 RepID=UPI001C73EF2E|nr:succinate dehydrogenase cytochrome b subunit [Modestobacter sp. L9-4]QXG75118.1 succinate dehydrogenase cytochrome b subunit [Modestobacter sp. L9-4]
MATVTTQPAQRRAPKTGRFSSSVVKKTVMAVSGIIMILYLIAHMIGNLHAFQGADEFNGYSHWLRTIGEPAVPEQTTLWIIRVVMLTAVVSHFWAAISLWRQARRARPVPYVTKKRVQQSFASRTVRWGGIILALFIVWHILDLTFGVVNPAGTGTTPYDRMIASFSNIPITLFYVVSMLILAWHIRHGIFAATQTLGQTNKKRERAVNGIAYLISGLIGIGFVIVPLSVAFGLID